MKLRREAPTTHAVEWRVGSERNKAVELVKYLPLSTIIGHKCYAPRFALFHFIGNITSIYGPGIKACSYWTWVSTLINDGRGHKYV